MLRRSPPLVSWRAFARFSIYLSKSQTMDPAVVQIKEAPPDKWQWKESSMRRVVALFLLVFVACASPAVGEDASTSMRVGQKVRIIDDGFYACSTQALLLAALFVLGADHKEAMTALFANEGDTIDCLFLDPKDPDIHSILIIDTGSEAVGDTTINYLELRVFTRADDGSRGVSFDVMSFVDGFLPVK